MYDFINECSKLFTLNKEPLRKWKFMGGMEISRVGKILNSIKTGLETLRGE